ncbi:MAG TPA: hypothetical protein VE573_12970, partial [Nitrososphaeraceae archaeon]|nr:hypothetical protein [Nitrososphaeraceae archaeon]
ECPDGERDFPPLVLTRIKARLPGNKRINKGNNGSVSIVNIFVPNMTQNTLISDIYYNKLWGASSNVIENEYRQLDLYAQNEINQHRISLYDSRQGSLVSLIRII